MSEIPVERKVRSVSSFKRKMRFWSKAQWTEIKSLQVLAAENGTFSTNSSDLQASNPAVRYVGPGDETLLQRHFQSMWKLGAVQVHAFSAGTVLKVLSPSGQLALVPQPAPPNTHRLR